MEDVKEKCRLCLQITSPDAPNLFRDDSNVIYSEVILDMLSIEVEDTPNWPCKSCHDCIDNLKQMTRFQDRIESTHKIIYAEIHEKKQADVGKKCRLCFRILFKEGTNLFRSEPETTSYADQILDMLSIEVVDTPNWPSNACFECVGILQKMTWFQELIVSSHKTLYKIMNVKAEEETAPIASDSEDDPEAYALRKRPLQLQDLFEDLDFTFADDDDPDYECMIEYDSDHSLEVPAPAMPTSQSKGPKKKKTYVKKKPVQSVVRAVHEPTVEELQLEALMLDMKIFVCRICDFDTESHTGLRRHLRKEHPTERKSYEICCTLKGMTYPTMLYDHFRLHLDKDAFKCKECGQNVLSSQNLKTHTLRYHSKEPPTHICAICGKPFWHKRPLEMHIGNHQGKVHKCKYCGNGFQRIHSLTSHIKTQHELEINFLCDLCGRGFFTMSRLKSHINDHGGPHGGRRRKKPKLP